MDVSTVVRRRSEPVFTRLDDELLALDPNVGKCYSLAGSATRVWELIESPIAIGTVRDRLVQEFDVDRDTCLADLLALMHDLDEAGLVSLGEPVS